MPSGPTHATPETEQEPARSAPAPAVAAPEAPLPLVVGHAEDRAEHEADAMADGALARLSRLEAGPHVHAPGCDHAVRRSATASGTAVVGHEGGVLDPGTSDAIEARRGTGRPLDADVRRRMETAFSRDLSSVRIHRDDHAARLSSAVSASAFTTGQDIFFGRQQYDPGSPTGERMLAHEIAHTLQPAGRARRLVDRSAAPLDPHTRAAIARGVGAGSRICRWELPWRKKKAAPAAASAPAPAAPAAAPKPPAYSGPAGKHDQVGVELGKPGIAGGITGSVALGTHLAKEAGGASEALGGLLVGDSLVGLNNARKMGNDAAEFDDAGMKNLAGRKGKNQANALLGAATSTAKAGVQTAFVHSGGSVKNVAVGVGNATLGTAAGALGVATGSAQVLQGMWRGGKAVQKLCRLAWGRAQTMLSARGAEWKKAIVSAEKYKLAIAAMKTTLGVLGIAAGALLIVSNPIGWGIGIAAAVAGGVYAAAKIAGKVSNARDRAKAAEQIAQGKRAEEVFGEIETEEMDAEEAEQVTTRGRSRSFAAAPPSTPPPASVVGFSKTRSGPMTPQAKARRQAIEQANEVARQASANARLADELRGALRQGNAPLVLGAIERSTVDSAFNREAALPEERERELHDSYLLLSSINVDPDEALSESGQDLVERKLSKVESM